MRELPVPANTILRVEVGSTAHGTGLPGGEDFDETVVVVETPNDIFGLTAGLQNHMQRTQPEGSRSGPGDIDRQIYSLRKFLQLASAGNPSIQLVLYAPVIEKTKWGGTLRNLAPAFIGRHVIPRYRGYMMSQVMRMDGLKGSGHGKRGGGKREELIDEHGYDVKFAMHAARLGFQCIELLTDWQLTLPIQGEPGEWLRAVRRGDISKVEWRKRVDTLDLKMAALLGDEKLPEGPNRYEIESYSIDTHRSYWGWRA
jgi:uncharacterized protein